MKNTKELKELLKTKQDILVSVEDFNKLQEILNKPAKKSNKMVDLLTRKAPWEEQFFNALECYDTWTQLTLPYFPHQPLSTFLIKIANSQQFPRNLGIPKTIGNCMLFKQKINDNLTYTSNDF